MTDDPRKGLRFEVFPDWDRATTADPVWSWRLVGKDGVVALSPETFVSDVEARSHISRNKGRLKGCGYAKVINTDD